jgi:hypothetical protein
VEPVVGKAAAPVDPTAAVWDEAVVEGAAAPVVALAPVDVFAPADPVPVEVVPVDAALEVPVAPEEVWLVALWADDAWPVPV